MHLGGERFMKIEYDKQADALYIQIRDNYADDNIDIEEGVSIDIDSDGHIIGIEILDVSKRLSLEELSKLTVERFPIESFAV